MFVDCCSMSSGCGLSREEIKDFKWVGEDSMCKAVCPDNKTVCGQAYSAHGNYH